MISTMRKLAFILGCLSLIACERSKRVRLDDVKLNDGEVLVDKSQDAGGVDEPKTLGCPADTKKVFGWYCARVEQTCLRWLDKDQRPEANSGIGPMRCAEFAPSKCLDADKPGGMRLMSFCIDKYEWPNIENEFPLVTIDWYSAKAKCESVGKRLCTADEWTFACEGPKMKPYPYGDGLHRDATACNIDEPSMDPSTPRSEWPKHNRSVPSGVMSNCVSWAGVHDMTGNVDEWVNNVGGRKDGDPYFSGLKGGYWSKVRNRCRPMTTVHGPTHSFYQQGFRCCRDVQP
jgi:sulfatase modifying factor 1